MIVHPPYTHISKIYFLLLVLYLEPLTPNFLYLRPLGNTKPKVLDMGAF